MKKIYLLAFASMFAAAGTAQTVVKIKNPLRKSLTHNERQGNPVSVQQVAASITCGTQYVAGTTMDLVMNYTTTNTDLEYVDYLEITFPTGITPTGLGNTSNPFPNTEDNGGGLEALNPVAGQVISWGIATATDEYGGIFAANGINFTVEVTVAPGLTGTQTANFVLDGDGYNLGTGGVGTTANGTFNIFPAGAMLIDLQTDFVQPLSLTALNVCNYGMDTLVAQVKNLGTTTESNFTAYYSVNGVLQPSTVVPGPLAPGDSTYVFWLPGYNFTPSNVYSLKAWTAVPSDISAINDTAALDFTNSITTPLSSTPYMNGCEAGYEFASLNTQGGYVSGDGYVFGPSQVTFQSGAQALFYTVPNAATAGVHEAMVILPCTDVMAGETYRITYWKRINGSAATANGQSGVFTGLANDPTAMTTVLTPYSAITPYATWIKDSVDYTATANETRYFALGGTGSVVSGSNQINVRFDNINIVNLATVGVNTAAISEEISIYPNPANGTVNVNLGSTVKGNVTIKVYDAMGKLVSSQTTQNNSIVKIEMNGAATGIYSVNILTEGKLVTKKLIIE